MMNTPTIVIALVGAFGVSLLLEAIFSPFQDLARAIREKLPAPKSVLDRAAATSPSGQAARQMDMDRVTTFRQQPLLDRLIAPLVEDFTRQRPEDQKQDLMDKLRRAGYPYTTAGDYYASKLLSGLAGFGVGIVVILAMDAPSLFFIPILGAILGIFNPNMRINDALKDRADKIYVEMAFTLDRLATLLEAGQAIDMALESLCRSPGGIFLAELRMYLTDTGTGMMARPALEAMRARLPHVDEIDSFCERILLLIEEKQQIAPSLRSLGARMRRKVESDILGRGLRRLLYVTAIGLATLIPGAMLTLAAMPLYQAIQMLR